MVASGKCVFCGAAIGLEFEKGKRLLQSDGATDDASPAPVQTTTEEEDAATKLAIEFKDRLVEFDRNSSKRTVVIDDQSDFFEIDSNTWLTDEERDQLRERQRCSDAVAAEARSRTRVTIDLMGRQVKARRNTVHVCVTLRPTLKHRRFSHGMISGQEPDARDS